MIPATSIAFQDDGTLPHRITSKIDLADDGCWNWTASLTTDGYGNLWWEGAMTKAHRTVYQIVRGPIHAGMVIDHICRNRQCVNPDHLRVVTRKENSLENSDAVTAHNSRKTHCPQGHEYDITQPDGRRWCRACRRVSNAKYYEKRKVES